MQPRIRSNRALEFKALRFIAVTSGAKYDLCLRNLGSARGFEIEASGILHLFGFLFV
jgi:hypothetical protein